ncbi:MULTISPECIES: hypothetical protein [Bacillus amyloliquefaciens group]|uniref:hypothetical protein n=1 Tax=Bacillus amyloliquefaciens group TaxID=1938374 RepID=UPI00073B77FD|nr:MULTISPECIES: hypothetical protein [Bacillus amyloliquefaciens group]KTF59771.1 hypothetical protein AR691_13640 [Bacillus amyloliquefaciens]
MSRISFSGARTGRRGNGGGFEGIQSLKFDIGEKKRLIFPTFTEEDGSTGLLMFAEPYHPITAGVVSLVSKQGNKWSPYKIRCMHPFSQTDPDVARDVAAKKQRCPFCELASMEFKHTYAEMEERYGDGFSELDKKEQKAFYEEMDGLHKVSASYYKKEDAEGNSYNVTTLDIFVLALELKLTKEAGKGGRTKWVPILDEETGLPKYDPILVPMSPARLNKFKNAADAAFNSETLDYDKHAYPFTENEGTEDEEEVLVGWVDFSVIFPQSEHKMQSGKDMTVTAMAPKLSVVSKELINEVHAKAKDLKEKAKKAFEATNVALRPFTPEEAINMMADQGEYYEQMLEEFGNPEEDDKYWEDVFAKILNGSKAVSVDDSDSEEDDDEGESKPRKKSKNENKKLVKKSSKKPIKKVVEDDEDDEEDFEMDFDEEEEEKPKKVIKKKSKESSKSDKLRKKKLGTKAKKKVKESEDMEDDEFDDGIFNA